MRLVQEHQHLADVVGACYTPRLFSGAPLSRPSWSRSPGSRLPKV